MKNILIATDLTINSDRALERALSLAKASGAKLHIFHATPLYLLPGPKKVSGTLREDTDAIIRSYIAGYSDAKAVKTAIHIAEGGQPFSEIINCAQQCKADLIVMGLHNKVGFSDLFTGTTIERVIRKGIKPVLVVRDKPKGDYKSILSGCDFSESSKSALTAAVRISPNAFIHLVHSYDFPRTSIGDKAVRIVGDVIESVETVQLEKFVMDRKKALKKYTKLGSSLSYETLRGEPVEVLNAEVKNRKADLLAIGVNSRSGIITSKIGGIAHEILANPPCDIVIAKAS